MVAAPLTKDLVLVSQGRKSPNLDLIDAIGNATPTLTRTIDGASTIEIPVADHQRKLLRSPALDERCWIVLGGIHFELVQVRKSGDYITLAFEDAIVAALRRQTSRLSVPAGTMTRAEFVKKLAREPRSNVPVDVDPTKRGNVQKALQRSVGEKSNSWDLVGEVASEVKWRRFSTGRRLVVGGDDWLRDRVAPIVLRENSGAVNGSIDFDLDAGKNASEANLTVNTTLFGLAPGSPVNLPDIGPATGKWLVAEITRPLTSTVATVRLVRPAHALKEPKRKAGAGDGGDPDYVPGQEGDDSGGNGGNGARDRMVNFALAQRGDTYVWGGNGPDGWDCSGLVQAATRAGGRELRKPSASQWEVCRAQGKTVDISTALRTRGGLLFRIGGEYNHVAISLGNGSTIEARGTGYGTGIFSNAAGGGWTGAAIWL